VGKENRAVILDGEKRAAIAGHPDHAAADNSPRDSAADGANVVNLQWWRIATNLCLDVPSFSAAGLNT
jgi:hypothetical protein